MNLPEHIIIIPDGNRRWARAKGLEAFLGHKKGAENTKEIFKAALALEIPCLTFWGSSADNITKRSEIEVKFLFSIFEEYFKKLITEPNVFENEVKVNILGRWRELFPEKLKGIMLELIEKTKNHNRHELTFLMAYSGLDEMRGAFEKVSALKAQKPELEITDELIKANLWTKDLPSVDLVIRTGGEPHWSNGLMMWDVADAQLYFTETLYPDFGVSEFQTAISAFGQKERRFGK